MGGEWLAVVDLDGDGCLDVVVANHLDPPHVLRNTCQTGNHSGGSASRAPTLLGTPRARGPRSWAMG